MPTTLSSEGGMRHQAAERVKEGKNITGEGAAGQTHRGPRWRGIFRSLRAVPRGHCTRNGEGGGGNREPVGHRGKHPESRLEKQAEIKRNFTKSMSQDSRFKSFLGLKSLPINTSGL